MGVGWSQGAQWLSLEMEPVLQNLSSFFGLFCLFLFFCYMPRWHMSTGGLDFCSEFCGRIEKQLCFLVYKSQKYMIPLAVARISLQDTARQSYSFRAPEIRFSAVVSNWSYISLGYARLTFLSTKLLGAFKIFIRKSNKYSIFFLVLVSGLA